MRIANPLQANNLIVVVGLSGELHINAKLTEVFSHSPKEDGRCVTGGIKVKLEN